MTSTEISGTEITDVAAKLEGFDALTDREREVLTAVFTLAGQAAQDHADDVAGFMPTAVESSLRLNLSNLPGGLVPAVRTAGLPAVQVGQFAAGFKAGFCDGSV